MCILHAVFPNGNNLTRTFMLVDMLLFYFSSSPSPRRKCLDFFWGAREDRRQKEIRMIVAFSAGRMRLLLFLDSLLLHQGPPMPSNKIPQGEGPTGDFGREPWRQEAGRKQWHWSRNFRPQEAYPQDGPWRPATQFCIQHLCLYQPLLQHCQCWDPALIQKLWYLKVLESSFTRHESRTMFSCSLWYSYPSDTMLNNTRCMSGWMNEEASRHSAQFTGLEALSSSEEPSLPGREPTVCALSRLGALELERDGELQGKTSLGWGEFSFKCSECLAEWQPSSVTLTYYIPG